MDKKREIEVLTDNLGYYQNRLMTCDKEEVATITAIIMEKQTELTQLSKRYAVVGV